METTPSLFTLAARRVGPEHYSRLRELTQPALDGFLEEACTVQGYTSTEILPQPEGDLWAQASLHMEIRGQRLLTLSHNVSADDLESWTEFAENLNQEHYEVSQGDLYFIIDGDNVSIGQTSENGSSATEVLTTRETLIDFVVAVIDVIENMRRP